jgi:hypothetical protein
MDQTHDPELFLYVRSLRPRRAQERQDAVLDRLAALEEQGVIGDYTVVVWGRQLPASEEAVRTEFGAALQERIEAFEDWARRNDYSTAETFPIREVETMLTGERTYARLLPRLCLAEFHGRALTFVTPVTGEGSPPTIEDRLDAIADGDATPDGVEPVERARAAGKRSHLQSAIR